MYWFKILSQDFLMFFPQIQVISASIVADEPTYGWSGAGWMKASYSSFSGCVSFKPFCALPVLPIAVLQCSKRILLFL